MCGRHHMHDCIAPVVPKSLTASPAGHDRRAADMDRGQHCQLPADMDRSPMLPIDPISSVYLGVGSRLTCKALSLLALCHGTAPHTSRRLLLPSEQNAAERSLTWV